MDELIEALETAENIEELISGHGGGLVTFVLVVTLLVGLLNCFLGYKLFKIMVSLTFGAILAAFGAALGAAYIESTFFFYVFTIGFFALGLWLGYKFYKAGLFLYLLVMSAVVSMAIFSTFMDLDSGAPLFLAAILGLVVAILGVVFVKPVVIVMTGLNGGVNAGTALAGLLSLPSMAMVFGAVLAVLGIIAQFMLEKKAPVAAPADGSAAAPQPPVQQPAGENDGEKNG